MKKIISLLTAAILFAGICGCSKTESSVDNESENYLGGKGKLHNLSYGIFGDESNVYLCGFGTLKKINRNTQLLSIACPTPGCTHDNPGCKANLGGHNRKYCVFNDRLIKIVNEGIPNNDGTYTQRGYVYTCGAEEKVFENTPPKELNSEDIKNADQSIIPTVLGDDYLAVYGSRWVYILDTDFNIKFTVLDGGPYSGGVFYIDNEIYYINKLYQLIKIDKESSEHSVVDLDSMKIIEGVTDGKTLWFSNGELSLCSYDPQTGEIKELAQSAVRMKLAGKYIEYMVYNVGDVYLYNIESGENRKFEGIDINQDSLFFDGENYYIYNDTSGTLTQYDEGLSSVINTYTLTD